jgi:hypothetical protein
MKRRAFLKILGIGAVVAAINPAELCGALAGTTSPPKELPGGWMFLDRVKLNDDWSVTVRLREAGEYVGVKDIRWFPLKDGTANVYWRDSVSGLGGPTIDITDNPNPLVKIEVLNET